MKCKIIRSQDGRINKILDESGKPSKLFQEIFNTPILSLEDSIEIYKNTYSEKVREQKESNKNIDFVFNQVKELSSIGTKEEYKKYLETVFPDSKVSDVVYHGTKREFDDFDERQIGTESDKNKAIGDFGEGFYFTEVLTRAQGYATDMQTGKQVGKVISALINIQNPDNSSQKTREQLLSEGNDGVIVSYGSRKYDEIVVPNASQIYVLGSQTDIENFKNWRQSSNEPTLFFQTPAGEKFTNYSEALQNTPEGDIELRVNDVIIGKVNADTSIDNYNGLLNHLVKQGILKSQRVLDVNGDQLFIPSGETDSATQLSSNIVEDILNKQLGASSYVRFDDGSFTIEDNLNTRIINGEKIKESEIADLNYEQLKNRFGEDTAIELETERQFEKDLAPSKLKRRLDEDTQVKTEDELVRSAKNLLNKLSIPITSIEEYVKNDTIKNGGVPTSASALVDMVNKVIAFKDGVITREDLIEETSHLIEASLPLDRTLGLRRNIHTTPEWKENAQNYYDIYSKEYSGEKLEDMVRREILGKVIANGISTNFELSQDATQTQQSIFQQIRQLLDEFFAKVNAYFTNNIQTQIDALNKDIYVKLLSGELANELDVNQNFGDKFRLYSASTNLNNDLVQIQKQAEKALTVLESQSYQIGRGDASQRQQLLQGRQSLGRAGEIIEEAGNQEDIMSKAQSEKLANAELASTFSYITNVAQKQLTYLQRAVKRNEDNSFRFSAEEDAVYHTLLTQFDNNILPSIRQTLENRKLKSKAENRILEEVKKLSDSIENLKGQVNTTQKNYKEHLVDLLVKRLDLSADKRAFIEEKVNGLQSEISFFFYNFGSLAHSSNIYLNSAAHVVTKVDFEKRQDTLEQTLPFVKRLKDLGWLNGKVKDFAKDGFIENRFNDKVREDAINEKRYETYKRISGDNLSLEEFNKKTNFENLTTDQKIEMNKEVQDWKLENYVLSALSPEETRERQAKLAGYSEVTQNYQRNSSLFYANLMQNAEIINGVPTFTEEMRYDYEQSRKQRVYDKSAYNLEGDLRDGIEYRTQQDYVSSLEDGQETGITKLNDNLYVSLIPATTDNSSILSFELNKIDNNRLTTLKDSTEERQFSPKFIETLNTFSDPTDAYNFLSLNAYIGYTNEYYESLDRPSIIDRLQGELGKDNDWKIQDLIEKISTTTKKLNTILQANRVMNNPSEVSFDNMEKNTEVNYVKEYSQDLDNYYSQASTLISKNNEEIEEDNLSETIPNESFRAYMSDKHLVSRLVYEKDVLDEDDLDNINKIVSEIVEHSTQKNKLRVLELKSFIKDFSNGKVNKIPKSYSKIFSLSENEYNEMSAEQVLSSMTNDFLKYGYTRLLPYFRKSQPTGVDTALNELRSGQLSSANFIENYLKGDYQYLKISPNYNFQEATEENNKNPHFLQARLQGTPLFRTFETSTTLEDVKTKSVDQLYNEGKLNKFVNKDFLKEYDIDLVKLFETGEETARKNENKFQAREAFIDLQKQTIENYGMTNAHNIYQLPQKEKGRLRKAQDIINNGKNLRELLDEVINYREEDASLGQDALGNQAKNMITATIPKFGLRKLKQGDVTDEILESYIWMNRESNLFKARNRNLGDFLAIREGLLGTQFENNLAVESSSVYKMLEDQLKFNFYGVKESFQKEFEVFGKRGNWGQVLRSFGSFIRFRNLAYNVTIPITSALTGSVQLRIERIVGERLDSSAIDRANKRFLREANASMRDVFELSSDSWMNAVGSKFGFFETEERYANSNYGKTVRGLGRSAFVAHTAANFGVNSRVGLAVLGDHRFVDGQLLTYRQFKEQNQGKSDKETREIWKNYRDIMDVSLVNESGVVSYDYAKIADALNTNMTVEEAKTFMEGKDAIISGRVKLALAAVDQQINPVDKSIAARNSILSFTTLHRSWIYLALQNKLKRRQFSTLSGELEEGSFITPFRIINDMVKDARAGNIKNVVEYVKTKWQDGSVTSKKNLIRGVTELGVLNALVALVMVGFKYLDDDEPDSKAFKVANLFLMRTANEVSSSSYSLGKNVYDILGDTIVGLSTLEDAADVADLFSGERVDRGRYSGLTKQQRYLYKQLPLFKDYNTLFRDPDGSINSYRFFNIEKDKSFNAFTIYPYLVEEK